MGAEFGQFILLETWRRCEYFGLMEEKEEEEEIDIRMHEMT